MMLLQSPQYKFISFFSEPCFETLTLLSYQPDYVNTHTSSQQKIAPEIRGCVFNSICSLQYSLSLTITDLE